MNSENNYFVSQLSGCRLLNFMVKKNKINKSKKLKNTPTQPKIQLDQTSPAATACTVLFNWLYSSSINLRVSFTLKCSKWKLGKKSHTYSCHLKLNTTFFFKSQVYFQKGAMWSYLATALPLRTCLIYNR